MNRTVRSLVAIMAFCCFLILVAGAPCSVKAESAPDFRTLQTSRELQQELLRFAKARFLHQLGYGHAPVPPSWAMSVQRPCFITVLSGRRVVACAGGFQPRHANLAVEIVANIHQALHMDVRAAGLDRRTAAGARVLITFPGILQPVASPAEVDPTRQGLFVESDRHGVAIVPGEAKTAAWAGREALRRLAVQPGEDVRYYRFAAWVIAGQ